MKKMRYSSVSQIFKSRGFAVALSICLIAIGAAAWVAISSIDTVTPSTVTADNSSRVESVISIAQSTVSRPEQTDTGSKSSVSKPGTTSSTTAESHAQTQSTVAVVTPTASFFVMPLTNEIIKPYNDEELQYSMTYGDWRLHTGIDIAGTLGDNVCSAGDGTVISVTDSATWGKIVKINHGNSIVASYCGMQSANVKEGDTVKVNEVIGTLGEIPAESIEPVHLHFSITKENTPINPMNIIGVNDAAHGSK